MRNRKAKDKGRPFVPPRVWGTRKKKGLDGRTLATSIGPSDEDVSGRPDIRCLDQTLLMVPHGPLIGQILHKIEVDDTLWLKMRWYVSRHVRKNFKKSIAPGTQ